MTAFAGLAILHASVAAALVEALLQVWRVQRPAERIALRWLALLAPLVLTPVYTAFAAFRAEPPFRLTWALFAGAHWDVLTIFGVPASSAATFVLVSLGVVLFVRDISPRLADRTRTDAGAPSPLRGDQAARLDRMASDAAARLGTKVPRLRLIRRTSPVLLCTGVARPTIEVSARTLDLLDDEALQAALLHETVHLRHRDPLHGWILIAVRTLQAVNPVAHVVARLIVEDIEARADEAVAGLGASPGLARAIACLSEPAAHSVTDLSPQPAWRTLLARARDRAVVDRCDRVLGPTAGARSHVAPMRMVAASLGLAVLLFFVV
ncbi:MAG: M56 family metallopeptidase [Acidobacteriota bacterium]